MTAIKCANPECGVETTNFYPHKRQFYCVPCFEAVVRGMVKGKTEKKLGYAKRVRKGKRHP